MSQAHKGSRLIIQDAVYAAPYDSACFDFSNDAYGFQYGNIIEPNVGSVYTMRPQEGKFSDAVAVEESTTNILSNPILTNMTGWSAHQNASFTEYSDYVRIQSADVFAGYRNSLSVVSGGSYIMSYWYRHVSGSAVVGNHIDNAIGTNIRIDKGAWAVNTLTPVPDDNKFHFVEVKWNATATTGSGFIYLQPARGEATVSAGDYKAKNGYGVQIENKAFSTSFVNGTRTTGSLNYDVGLNSSEGTISLWVLVDEKLKDTTDFRHIFSVKTASGVDNGLVLYHDKAPEFGLRTSLNGTSMTTIKANDSKFPNGWRHVAVRWNSTKLAIFVDGVEAGSAASPFLPTGFDKTIWIGNKYSAAVVNTLMSNLKIDRYYASDEEILSWYVANKPFYNPYDYRAYGY